MVEINLEACKALAVQYGLPLQFVVKEFCVFDVLGQVVMSTAPSKRLVFKGGTALNKVYLGGMQRFSEDLDFDFDTETLSEARAEAQRISGHIEGYRISDFRTARKTVQFDCEYDSQLGGRDHVRIDVAAKRVITEKPTLVKPAVSAYTQRSVTGFYVYALEDLVARKLNALQTRGEGKDFYDASNALPLCGKMESALQKMLESEKRAETPAEFIGKAIKKVQEGDPKKLRNLTNPFIPAGNRPKDWEELKNDLLLKLEKLV